MHHACIHAYIHTCMRACVQLYVHIHSHKCYCPVLQALGSNRVISVHIDNGFLRKGESKQVEKSLKDLGIDLIVVNGSHHFLNATTVIASHEPGEDKLIETPRLNSVVSPEEKRNIIGDTFMQVYYAVNVETITLCVLNVGFSRAAVAAIQSPLLLLILF